MYKPICSSVISRVLLLYFQQEDVEQEDVDKEATSEREAESEEKELVDGETEAGETEAVGEEDTSEEADKRDEITQRILNIMANFLEGEVRIDIRSS